VNAEISFEDLQNLLRRVASLDQYLTVAEAADYIRCRKAEIYRRIKGGFPAYNPMPGKLLLRKRDLDALVREHRYDPDKSSVHASAHAASAAARA
jgi:excisionase family DNA binding protein